MSRLLRRLWNQNRTGRMIELTNGQWALVSDSKFTQNGELEVTLHLSVTIGRDANVDARLQRKDEEEEEKKSNIRKDQSNFQEIN